MRQPLPKFAGKPVLLETPNFVLRSLKPSDAGPTLASWFDDHAVLSGLNMKAGVVTRKTLPAFIAKFDNYNRHIIGTYAKQDMRMIGFHQVNVVRAHKLAQISFVMGNRDFRGKPLPDELTAVLVNEFFQHRDVEKFVARVAARNFAALWIMKQSIFEFEAVLKQDLLLTTGKRSDVVQFRCLKDQWAC